MSLSVCSSKWRDVLSITSSVWCTARLSTSQVTFIYIALLTIQIVSKLIHSDNMKIIQHKSIIFLNVPQLIKPKAKATVARNQNSIRWQNGEKNLGRNQAQLGASSPLAPNWTNSVWLWFRQHYRSEVRLDYNIQNISKANYN